MAKKLVLLFFLSLFLSLPLKGQRQEQITLQLIPYPQKLVFGEGTFFSKIRMSYFQEHLLRKRKF